jgi:hypothetical protein
MSLQQIVHQLFIAIGNCPKNAFMLGKRVPEPVAPTQLKPPVRRQAVTNGAGLIRQKPILPALIDRFMKSNIRIVLSYLRGEGSGRQGVDREGTRCRLIARTLRSVAPAGG